MSKFNSDLKQERILADYLDDFYRLNGFKFKRIINNNLQHRGIDLVIEHNNKSYNIDEKAQLHYLNSDLPTFTFEISYLNNKNEKKQGWLFDDSKVTDYYFLITSIKLQTGLECLNTAKDISGVKVTSINRKKLLKHLNALHLSLEVLERYDTLFREIAQFGKTAIKELNPKKQGSIFYSEHLSEKPLNLQLRIDWLIKTGVGKRL